ncbi:hypothetical protein, conserved [Babesia bigemina]|uniref:Uncharacterized protein n=1 Tax=Babesia bigemina TaxID=5866 RepID=A0A061DD94_BABBI|nr:hypothetical protein, conserved [Babesia bigemina]CDR97204.1 hypothetical protein, conserved [Babesia bigemina]|eukprot:XP_012769390.1 hypothetical protein, conserved [Babesia bigemina]
MLTRFLRAGEVVELSRHAMKLFTCAALFGLYRLIGAAAQGPTLSSYDLRRSDENNQLDGEGRYIPREDGETYAEPIVGDGVHHGHYVDARSYNEPSDNNLKGRAQRFTRLITGKIRRTTRKINTHNDGHVVHTTHTSRMVHARHDGTTEPMTTEWERHIRALMGKDGYSVGSSRDSDDESAQTDMSNLSDFDDSNEGCMRTRRTYGGGNESRMVYRGRYGGYDNLRADTSDMGEDVSGGMQDQDSNEPSDATEDVDPTVIAANLKLNSSGNTGYNGDSFLAERPMTDMYDNMDAENSPSNEWSDDSAEDGSSELSSSLDGSLERRRTTRKAITTAFGLKRRVEESLSFHRIRYIYVSEHTPLWTRVLPLGGYVIQDDEAADAMTRLRNCYEAKRPLLTDNVRRLNSLDARLKRVFASLRFRLGMDNINIPLQAGYHRITNEFRAVHVRATAYFKGLTAVVSYLQGQYRSPPRMPEGNQEMARPITVNMVEPELDRCVHDDSYGTSTSIRACLDMWELYVTADTFEIEAMIDHLWLNKLETPMDQIHAIALKALAKIEGALQVPQCLNRLEEFEGERELEDAVKKTGIAPF